MSRDAYRPKEACERLGFKKSKLYELMKRGEIHSYRVDGCRCISRVELEGFIAKREAASRAERQAPG